MQSNNGVSQHPLPLPTPSDSLETLSVKLSSYAHVLSLDRSLAAATSYRALPGNKPDAESRAKNEMRPEEREFFEAWEASEVSALPAIDWEIHRASTPQSPRGLKRATRRAEALNRLYSTDQAAPCHAVWFTQEHLAWLPLVKAMARIIGAEKSGSEDLAQLETLNKIIRTAVPIVQRSGKGPVRKSANANVLLLNQTRSDLRRRMDVAERTGKRKREEDITAKPEPELEPEGGIWVSNMISR